VTGERAKKWPVRSTVLPPPRRLDCRCARSVSAILGAIKRGKSWDRVRPSGHTQGLRLAAPAGEEVAASGGQGDAPFSPHRGAWTAALPAPCPLS